MAKLKRKINLGKKAVQQIEVESLSKANELSNSFISKDGTINHNCNGPHVPLVVVDEIDTVSGEGVKAFKEITGMVDSKGNKMALRVGISTRKSQYGLMNQQIENAEGEGRTVRRWTAFEFTKKCPDDRSGTERITLYTIQDKLETITEEEYLKKDPQKQKDYEKHEGYTGCAKCPLFSICLTDAKNQISASPMLKPISELIQKVKTEGADWALSQLMNLKPSIEGIIFREFEERVHVKTWSEMWKILVGKDFPGECTHDIFVKKCHEMQLSCYAGIDWGWSNPHTVTFFFVDKRENVYVVRTEGMTYISQPQWIHMIKTKWHNMYRTALYFPDQADQGAVQEMKLAGLPVHDDKKKPDISPGIQVIKRFLRVPATSDSKLFLAKDTLSLIIEFKKYHNKMDAAGKYIDDPEDEDNHWIDGFRYAMHFLFGSSSMVLTGDGLNIHDTVNSIMDSNGNFLRSPTAEEFATSKNLQINTEVNTNNLGKMGKLSELDDDKDEDPDGGVSGSGNFLWTS